MASRGRPPHPDILTPRELEVLGLLREGMSNGQIATRLSITERTARFHVSEILSKLGVAGREEAALWNPAERKPWWMALLHWPIRWSIVVKIAGAGLLAGTAGGIGLLTWGVVATDGPPLDDERGAAVQAGPVGFANDGPKTWTEDAGYPAPDGNEVSCIEWEWDGYSNRDCGTGGLPKDCFPYEPPTVEEAEYLRSLLGYAPDVPNCVALRNEEMQLELACFAEQRAAGVTDQEQIWRICLNH